jgi:hypothetical protein
MLMRIKRKNNIISGGIPMGIPAYASGGMVSIPNQVLEKVQKNKFQK